MTNEREAGHRGSAQFHADAYRSGSPRVARTQTGLRRFLGGSPAAVFVKLLLLSVVVGAALALFGLTPGQLFWRAFDVLNAAIELGLDTFHEFGSWILAGAVVVIPLWLIGRLLAVNRS